MESSLKPVFKRQVAFVGAAIGIGLVLTYFFGFLVGITANIAIFVAAIFLIRWHQQKALKSFGFSSQTAGPGHEREEDAKLKYVCLLCGAQVKRDRCSCGSSMKKPLF